MQNAERKIAKVSIEPDGVMKYVLVRFDKDDGTFAYLVRGKSGMTHSELLNDCKAEITYAWGYEARLRVSCMGGGGIAHSSAAKTIVVYGYSISLGRAPHAITVKKLSAKYPDYTRIVESKHG
jgi:hypothetical protein